MKEPSMRLTSLSHILCFSVLCLFMVSMSYGDIIHVDADTPPGGDGTSWAYAFDNLQSALDIAAASDEIRVAEGVYLPTLRNNPADPRSASFEMIEEVSLEGGYAGIGHPDPNERDIENYTTILSGDLNSDDLAGFINREDNCYHVVFNNENDLTASAVLDGFTISGGNANVGVISGVGGGMFLESSSPTLIQCTFTDNLASHGAGLKIGSSTSMLTDCTFVNNKTADFAGFGGGLHCTKSEVTLTRCIFSGNIAVVGAGGTFFETGGIMTDCLFTGNEANDAGGMHTLLAESLTLIRCVFSNNIGGGMMNDLDTDLQLVDCLFKQNISTFDGGGMANLNAGPILTNCVFIENSTEESGGGVANIQASTTFHNCVFSNNSAAEYGGGIYNYILASPMVVCCTFHENTAAFSGGAIYNYQSSPLVSSCNFRGSFPDEIVNSSLSNPSVIYCNVEGGYPGEGNIDADPQYVDADHHDFHMEYTSPCRDGGSAELVIVPETDFEGDPRIVDINMDIGVDEFHTHFYCTGDFTPGGTIEGKFIGTPGSAPVGLFFGAGKLDPPMNTPWGAFHLQSPWLLIPLVPIPSNGVLVLGGNLPTELPAPYELYLQALIGLDTNSLTNLYILEVR